MANEDVTNRDLLVVLQKHDAPGGRAILDWRPLVVIDVPPPRRVDMTAERLLDAYAKDYALDPSTLGYAWAPRIALPPSAYFEHDWFDFPAEPAFWDAGSVCRRCKRLKGMADPSCPGLRRVDEGDLRPARYRRLVDKVVVVTAAADMSKEALECGADEEEIRLVDDRP